MFKCLLLLLWFIGMHFVYLYSIISVLGFALFYLVSLPLCLSSAAPSTATSGVSRRRQRKQYHRCLSVLHGLHVVLVFSLVFSSSSTGSVHTFLFIACITRQVLSTVHLYAYRIYLSLQLLFASVLITIFHCCSLSFILL